jgi:hypothetical protein
MALEEPEIRSTDPNILIDNNDMDDELHFGTPGGSEDYKNICDESNEGDTVARTSRK